MKIIAIIGGGNTGKTTTIRHISGRNSITQFNLRMTGGDIKSFVQVPQSPQEGEKVLPQALNEILLNYPSADYAIIAFRINRVGIAPPYEEYLTFLQSSGHTIDHVFNMGATPPLHFTPIIIPSNVGSNIRANEIKRIVGIL